MAAPAELRARSEIARWLAAGLSLQRVPSPTDPEGATRADSTINAALVACAGELRTLPPPGVIADLALLLDGARLVAEPAATSHDALRAALRAYDDDLLGRLASTSRFDDAIAAMAHLATARRSEAVALLVDSLMERCGFEGVAVSPGALRRELARGRATRETVVASLAEAAPGLAADYRRLARGARQTRQLVDDREIFTIDHLEVLGSFGRRLAARHIAAAAEAITGALPRRLPARREQRGAAATRLTAEDTYPVGGFSSITPGGAGANLENLVTSELAYMEDDDAIDVFTLRYVEGELLFYTRDDSVFRRHRHAITFVLAADLAAARVKDPALPWQRLVLTLGLLVAATRWLIGSLGEQALTIRLVFPPAILGAERELVALLLAGEVEAGLVVVEEAPWTAALDAAAQVDAPLADLIIVAMGTAPTLARTLRAAHLGLATEAPTFRDLEARTVPLPESEPDLWRAWSDVIEELLRWLV